MTLQEKYKSLIDLANKNNLKVTETENGLNITGDVSSADVKDSMWSIYGEIDPDFKSGDLVLNVNVKSVEGGKVKVITQSSALNIRQGPGTDQPIVGKAAHGDVITLVSKSNAQWWLVRDNNGKEGYCYAQYLEPIQ